MDFLIADTFTSSLVKLTTDEQRLVKTTAFELQMNPSGNGISFQRLDRSKDPNFWSVSVSSDLRLIVHRLLDSLMLCYVGHHKDAYNWAERRKLTVHPKTGAPQMVEIREIIQKVVIRQEHKEEATPLFADLSDDDLLWYGVPEDWPVSGHVAPHAGA